MTVKKKKKNSTSKMNIRQYYEVNIFKVLTIIYHRFHAEKQISWKLNK